MPTTVKLLFSGRRSIKAILLIGVIQWIYLLTCHFWLA